MLRSGGRLWSVDHGEANNFVVFSQWTLNFNLMTKHDVYYNQLIRTEKECWVENALFEAQQILILLGDGFTICISHDGRLLEALSIKSLFM